MNAPASTTALLAFTTLLSCAGCGDDGRLPTHPVFGQVMINGQPADGCTVTLIPADAQLQSQLMPGGLTDAEGKFQLTTYETHDGAPAGPYGVILHWEAKQWPGKEAESQLDPGPPVGPDRLMGNFSSSEQSGLRVQISEGSNQLEPFRLDNVRLLPGSN